MSDHDEINRRIRAAAGRMPPEPAVDPDAPPPEPARSRPANVQPLSARSSDDERVLMTHDNDAEPVRQQLEEEDARRERGRQLAGLMAHTEAERREETRRLLRLPRPETNHEEHNDGF